MLDIRTATEVEFAVAVGWAASEGWNPGLDDLSAFFAADPGGFLMGYVDDQPTAAISVVQYGQSFGFLGFYIVHPDHRGQGHGIALWDKGMERLAGRTVGLDGVVAQQENYRKSGFAFAGQNVRFAGSAPSSELETEGGTVRRIETSDMPQIVDYDRPFFADDRSAFLKRWIDPAGAAQRTCMIAERDGAIIGFGVVRTCLRGSKVGPLFADNLDIAHRLFNSLASTLPQGTEIVLDVPADNAEAVALAEDYGLEAVFETARMYRGAQPELPLNRTFGITTFELG